MAVTAENRGSRRSSAHPSRTVLLDLLTAVIVIGTAFAPLGDTDARTPPESILDTPLLLAAPIAAALVLPLRRRWPVAVLAATVLIFAIAVIAGAGNPFFSLPIAIAAFGLAARRPRRVAVMAVSAAIVVLVGVVAWFSSEYVFDPRVIQIAAVVAFATAMGDATRSRHAYIAAIEERAERAELTRESEARRQVAEERLRIARDLHDVVAHQIAVINLHAGVASRTLASDPAATEASLGTIRSAARTVLGEIGNLLSVLRSSPSGTGEPGEADAGVIVVGLADLEELVESFRTSGLDVTLRTEGPPHSLPPTVDGVAYRVVQEALTNAQKHGSVARAHLLVQHGETDLTLTVTNPVGPGQGARPGAGAGTEAGALERPIGHGLIGIRERVASVHGTVETATAGGIHRLAVRLPLAAPASATPQPADTVDDEGERR